MEIHALVSLCTPSPSIQTCFHQEGGVTAGAPIREDGDFELSYLMSFSYVGAHSSGPVDREIVSGVRFSGAKFWFCLASGMCMFGLFGRTHAHTRRPYLSTHRSLVGEGAGRDRERWREREREREKEREREREREREKERKREREKSKE